ncbi:MAG TPA: methyltransferase domain-containing protein [Balneolaceae bacterium]|nr:methyltransferase domain-containing protein [Balneolaceae bacterium]
MSEKVASNDDLKQKIISSFGSVAGYYDQHAELQQQIAGRLIASLEPWVNIIPPGPIIELGCGTGFVTKGLINLFPKHEIQATDLSEEMVDYCRAQFGNDEQLKVAVQDADEPPYEKSYYGMTISSFLANWLKDPALSFAKWLEATQPGGLLLAAFPGNESFPNWRRYCRELGLPFTGNPWPDVEEIVVKMSVGPSQVDYYEDTVTQTFDSARDFFNHRKAIGASTQTAGRSLTADELSLLVDHWDSSTEGKVKVNYHIIFLAVKRDYE